MSTLEILTKAREHIADPKNWTRDEFFPGYAATVFDNAPLASTPTPDDVEALHAAVLAALREATCMCAVGALCKAADVAPTRCPYGHATLGDALRLLDSCLPPAYHSVPEFNDDGGTPHADALALFDRAIAKAKEIR